MSNNNNFGLYDLGALGLIGFLIYGGIKLFKLNDVSKKLDVSLKDLSALTPAEIRQSVVDRATERAVDREVTASIQATTKKISDQIRADMNREVRTAVKSQYEDISDKVTRKVSEEVAAIDRTSLTRKIADRAEDLVIEKLDKSTDEALEKFNRGIGNITKIYEGISNVMAGTTGKSKNGLTFHLD